VGFPRPVIPGTKLLAHQPSFIANNMKQSWLLLLCSYFVVAQCVPGSLVINVHYPEHKLPKSAFLALRGDNLGLSWDSGVRLNRSATNLWTLSIPFECSSVGTRVNVKVLVNDKGWQIGANERFDLPSKSASVDLYPFFYTTEGQYSVIPDKFYSSQLNNSRQIVVYTPPSYYENTLKHVPLLIMHDGQNLFNDSTAAFGVAWNCQDTINAQVVQAEMQEVLIAGVYNTPQRLNEYTYSYDSSVPGGGMQL